MADGWMTANVAQLKAHCRLATANCCFEVIELLQGKGKRHTCETDKSTAQVHVQHLVEDAHLIASEQLILSDIEMVSKMGMLW